MQNALGVFFAVAAFKIATYKDCLVTGTDAAATGQSPHL
jgi:hypothetical protein